MRHTHTDDIAHRPLRGHKSLHIKAFDTLWTPSERDSAGKIYWLHPLTPTNPSYASIIISSPGETPHVPYFLGWGPRDERSNRRKWVSTVPKLVRTCHAADRTEHGHADLEDTRPQERRTRRWTWTKYPDARRRYTKIHSHSWADLAS